MEPNSPTAHALFALVVHTSIRSGDALSVSQEEPGVRMTRPRCPPATRLPAPSRATANRRGAYGVDIGVTEEPFNCNSPSSVARYIRPPLALLPTMPKRSPVAEPAATRVHCVPSKRRMVPKVPTAATFEVDVPDTDINTSEEPDGSLVQAEPL